MWWLILFFADGDDVIVDSKRFESPGQFVVLLSVLRGTPDSNNRGYLMAFVDGLVSR